MSISFEMLRTCDYAGIENMVNQVNDFGKVVVNAIDYNDVKVFAM